MIDCQRLASLFYVIALLQKKHMIQSMTFAPLMGTKGQAPKGLNIALICGATPPIGCRFPPRLILDRDNQMSRRVNGQRAREHHAKEREPFQVFLLRGYFVR